MNENQKSALMVARELYPNSPIDDLIKFAKKIEYHYYKRESPDDGIINFCRSRKIQHPTKGSIPFSLYDFQICYLLSLQEHKNIISVSARQMGTGLVLSKYAYWEAINSPDLNIEVTSSSFATIEQFRNRIIFAHNTRSHLDSIPDIISYSSYHILFSNNSSIRFTSIDSLGSKKYDIAVIDNAAYISYSKINVFWAKYNRLEYKPRLILNSGAGAPTGLFYDLYSNPGRDWHTMVMPWHMHPDRDQIWANNQINSIGQSAFDKDYNCVFA